VSEPVVPLPADVNLESLPVGLYDCGEREARRSFDIRRYANVKGPHMLMLVVMPASWSLPDSSPSFIEDRIRHDGNRVIQLWYALPECVVDEIG
jgi:hypothetical protein